MVTNEALIVAVTIKNRTITEEKMLLLLKKELEKVKGEPYETVQDKLIELASVYGNRLIITLNGLWFKGYRDKGRKDI